MALLGERSVILLLLVTHVLQQAEGSLKWLAMDRIPANNIWESGSVCSKSYGLTGRQARFCKKNFAWMKYVQDTVQETKEECIEQFKHKKWNCMSVNKAPKFDMDLKKDTKEAGFLYALSAAALALSVSKGCMAGNIPDCRCNRGNKQLSFPTEVIDSKNLSFIDARLGCKGILQVGQDFSQTFLNLGFKRKSKNIEQLRETVIRRHNVKVGLQAVQNGEEIACVCNGATAGCVVKYCYRRLVQLQEISETLFKKYGKAIKAETSIDAASLDPAKSNDIIKGAAVTLQKDSDSILYSSVGPDHCSSKKTARRRCEIDESKPNSCKKLCCGRGFREKTIEIVSQCDCKFVFCCKVECSTCRNTRRIYECL